MSGKSKLGEWDVDNLERAVKHMRELDQSRNAKAAMELARREQDVELARAKQKEKEAEVQRAQAVAQAEQIRWEEQRKTLQHKSELEKANSDYKYQRDMQLKQEEDKMNRRRDEDNRAKAMEDERMKIAMRRKAEEDMQAERRRSDEHRAKLERETMKARALAEAEGRIREQRENEEIFARQAKLRAAEDRITRLESIAATASQVRTMVADALSSPQQLGVGILAITALAGGVYGMRESARVMANFVQKRLGTPSLVRETSRSTRHFSVAARAARALGLSKAKEGYSFSDVILRRDIADRVSQVAVSVRNTRANGAPYRHMLFYGPPGTGKTMVAKRLARTSGLDYAIMSGGDVGPLGRDAVTELHKMFDWAETSGRGLLLFIDEADAFLASRSKSNMSEEQRNALNALLFRTGEASKKFMLVMATNRPGDLDRAVADRVDEAMIFDLPDADARRKLVAQYFDTYITRAGEEARYGPFGLLKRSSAAITVDAEVDAEYLKALADRLEGFSGREISKLFISAQGSVYGRAEPKLTKAVMEEVVAWKLREHADKAEGFHTAAFDFTALGGSKPKAKEMQ